MKPKDILEASIVPEQTWEFTKEEECRLEAMKNVGNILYAGRITPPTLYEIFELLHYLDHWLQSGAVPKDPRNNLRLVGDGP